MKNSGGVRTFDNRFFSFADSKKQYPTVSFDEVSWVTEKRNNAAESLERMTLPSVKDEEWKFTDLQMAYKKNYSEQPVKISEGQLDDFLFDSSKFRLVMVNGMILNAESRLSIDLTREIYVGGYGLVSNDAKGLLDKWFAGEYRDYFATLNTVSFQEAAVILVKPGVTIEDPVHVLNISTGKSPISHPRIFINIGAGSQMSLVEEYVSLDVREGFTNTVCEIVLQDSARLMHSRLQREHSASFNIGNTTVEMAKSSRYENCSVTTGCRISRQNLDINQEGDGAEAILRGLSIISQKQHSDLHSSVLHNCATGSSDQLYKTIIGDGARAVFNGKIIVSPKGGGTNASQKNQNLILTQHASVDTKPQLEIFCDNVKCAHGATVGRLDDEELFYLRSRGVDEEDAKKLLIHGFAGEVTDKFRDSHLEKWVRYAIVNKGRG